MELSSAYDITPVPFNEQEKTQGSKLTINDPQKDTSYTCRVKPDDQEPSDTTGNLVVYGTYLNCLNHLHNFKS